MKKYTRLLSLAIVGCSLMVSVPADADTVYHRVYRQPVTATDPFSILDQYRNNVLSPEDYKKGSYKKDFSRLDADHDWFLSRSEFYQSVGTTIPQKSAALSAIAPAAGGTERRDVPSSDIVYHNDPCDVTAHRNEPICR